MDFSNIPLFSVMRGKMGYISERQGVLAQNVANADTPGYQAKDVAIPDFKKMVADTGALRMGTTSVKHLSGPAASTHFAIINRVSTYERNPTENNVSIEEEMSKIAENQAEYQKVLNLYRKTLDMFKIAIGKPNGA